MRDMIITSSILILAIIAVRHLAKGRIHPLLQYSLWLLVVFKLLIPIPLWSSRVSVLNLFPDGLEKENMSVETESFTQDKMSISDIRNIQSMQNHVEHNADVLTGASSAASFDGTASKPYLPAFLTFIWLAGMTAVGGYMIFYRIKLQRYLRINRKPLSASCNEIMNIPGIPLSAYIVNGLPSPCLSGRSIYLTADMAEDKKQLEHILAHEYCHYRHLDSLWVIVRCVLTVIYWFNPLVWAAAYISKQDSEFACDAAVISMLGEDERIAYGKTLIDLISGDSLDISRIGIASMMSGGEKGMRERIFKIAGKPKYIAAAAGIVILIAAALTAVTFSGTWKENDAGQENDIYTMPEPQYEAAIQAGLAEAVQSEPEDGVGVQSEPEEGVGGQQESDLSEPFQSEKIELLLSQAEYVEPLPHQSAMQISYINPCPSYTRIAGTFGTRVNPVTNEEYVHNGVDMAAEQDDDIVAAAGGIVCKTGYNSECGNHVVIYHGMENFTYYTCCSEILVSEGDRVESGQKIATVGRTGRSTGPHLHFMVSSNGEYIEPVFR